MTRLRIAAAGMLLMVGCGRQAGGGVEAVLENVVMPNREAGRPVLYGSPHNEDCVDIAQRVEEVRNAPSGKSIVGGLSSRDVQGRFSQYRAYFLPSQNFNTDRSEFVLCQGENAPLIPLQCDLLGITPKGCFQTDIYGISDANGLKASIDAILKHWPVSLDEKKP